MWKNARKKEGERWGDQFREQDKVSEKKRREEGTLFCHFLCQTILSCPGDKILVTSAQHQYDHLTTVASLDNSHISVLYVHNQAVFCASINWSTFNPVWIEERGKKATSKTHRVRRAARYCVVLCCVQMQILLQKLIFQAEQEVFSLKNKKPNHTQTSKMGEIACITFAHRIMFGNPIKII